MAHGGAHEGMIMNKYFEMHPAVTIALVLGAAVTSSFLTLPAAHTERRRRQASQAFWRQI